MSLEQKRAQIALKSVKTISEKDKDEQKRYATVVYQAIALIQTAGIVQAISFLHAITNEKKREQGKNLINQLATHLSEFDASIKKEKGQTLFDCAVKADLSTYMLLTKEAISALVWHRRFVQSILKIDRQQANEGNDD